MTRIKIFQSVQSLGRGLHGRVIGICFRTMRPFFLPQRPTYVGTPSASCQIVTGRPFSGRRAAGM